MPLISVIIPMRNAEPFVRAAIESVLAQRDVELEMIVIEDGSTDRSADVVRSIADPRVRIIPGPQKGISAAFNAGLAAAKGEFLARCDADDLYPPDRLAWQLEFLLDHPEFGAVSGSFATTDSQGKIIEQKSDAHAGDVTDELRAGRGRSHVCAYLFRTQILRDLGGCREFFVTAEDVDLQLRLAEITRIWHDSRPAYLYRLHDASITHVQRAAERSFYEQAAQTFQEQRLTRGKDDLDLGQPPSPPKADASAPVSAKQQIQNILLGQAWAAHGAGAKCEAIKLGARAWMASPFKLAAWKSLAALVIKSASSSPGTPGEAG
jgi:glycosyltransferase involved in cell wall biosynthesis